MRSTAAVQRAFRSGNSNAGRGLQRAAEGGGVEPEDLGGGGVNRRIPETAVEDHDRDVDAGEEVAEVAVELPQLRVAVPQLLVDGRQLLVRRLDLLLGRLQLLVRALQLLVRRQDLLLRRAQLLFAVSGPRMIDCRNSSSGQLPAAGAPPAGSTRRRPAGRRGRGRPRGRTPALSNRIR